MASYGRTTLVVPTLGVLTIGKYSAKNTAKVFKVTTLFA